MSAWARLPTPLSAPRSPAWASTSWPRASATSTASTPANWKGLDFDALDKIHASTNNIPLVLHGGTGIHAALDCAISLGVSKINVNTECQLSFADATRKYIEAGKDLQGKGFDPRKLLAPGAEAIKATVREKIELFGSANKA